MDDSPRRFGWPKRSIEASGIASVAIAGNNLAPVSTNVFIGDWFPLLRAYLDPSSLDAQINLENFVGREWLFKEIDDFISGNPNGYFVIEADAGMGKTAFALQLTKRGGHASHFACLDWSTGSADAAIRNISAQLIAAWNLPELAPQGMLPPGADRPSWLWHVLSSAAEQRDRIDPTRPLVLVIDGLDEAEPHPSGTMPFGLPPKLPPGVFVIATTRTGTPLPALRQPYQTRLLEAQSATNQWDMARYVRRQVTELGLIQRTDDEVADSDTFSQQLLERCSGVWIYLECVLSEIRYGLRQSNEIGNLPADLEGYYAQNLATISESEDWLTWYLPLLATLGVAAEPLYCTQIANFAGIDSTERIHRFLSTRFRPFCGILNDANKEERFFLYHRSLVDFISGDFDGSALTGTQGTKAELRRAARLANERICRFFIDIWGEVSNYFPPLQANLALAELEAGYGVRHLVSHLNATGRVEEVEILVSESRQPRNIWYEAHDHIGDWDGYLRDVQMARQITENKTDILLKSSILATTLGAEYRYSLVSSSITSQVARIPVALLEALVSTGAWPAGRSLEHIRRINDRAARADAYIGVLPHLTGPQRLFAWREALAASTGIDDAKVRAKTLLSLAPLVPGQQQSVVLQRAYETGVIQQWEYRIETLVAFCRNVKTSFVDTAFSIAKQITNEEGLARCLIVLAPGLTDSVMSDAFAVMNNLANEEMRAEFLLALTTGSAIQGFVDQALDVARNFHDRSARAKALAAVAQLLDEESTVQANLEALRAARAIERMPERAVTLTYIASRLASGDLRSEVIYEVLSVVENLEDSKIRVAVVAQICGIIGETDCRSALLAAADMVRASDDEELIIFSSALLAPYLPREKGAVMLREALKRVARILDRSERDGALEAIAAEWPAHANSAAVSFSSRIDNDFSRTKFLCALVPRMERDLLGQVVTVAEEISDNGCRNRFARILAPCVPGQLLNQVLNLLIENGNTGDMNQADGISDDMEQATDMLIQRRHYLKSREGLFRQRWQRPQFVRMGTSSSYMLNAATYSPSDVENDYCAALIALAPRINGSLLAKALSAGLVIDNPLLRLEVLTAYLSRVSGEKHDVIASDALRTAGLALRDVYEDEESDAKLIAGRIKICVRRVVDLICALPESLRNDGMLLLETCLQQYPQEWDAWDLVTVFGRLPDQRRPQLMKNLIGAVSEIKDASTRTAALISLLAVDSEARSEIAASALESTRRIPDADGRALAIASIIPHLPYEVQKIAARSALRSSLSLRDDVQRVAALAGIVRFVEFAERQDLLDEMVMIATTIPSPARRCQALASSIPEFSGDRRNRIFADALAAARGLVAGDERCRYLLSLATISDSSELVMILDEVSHLDDDSLRDQAIVKLSLELSGELISKALSIAQAIDSEKNRVNALTALCPRLSKSLLDELAKSVSAVRDSRSRLTLIQAVARSSRKFSRMAGDPSMSFRIWADGLDRLESFGLIYSSAWWAAKFGGENSLIEISDSIIDVTRWWL